MLNIACVARLRTTHKFHSALYLCALGTVILGGTPLSAAPIIIDSFDTDQSLAYSGTGSQTAQGLVVGPGILGGDRETRIRADAFTSGSHAASLTVSGGVMILNVTQGTLSSSPTFMVYDGVADANIGTAALNGLGNLDLTAGGATAFVFSGVSSNRDVRLQITMQGATGMNGGHASFLITGGTNDATILLPYSDFGPQADFTNAGALEFGISQGIIAPATVQIGEIRTNGQTVLPTVPEPGSLALLASGVLGLLGLGCRGRRIA